jgi:hypothetical protein
MALRCLLPRHVLEREFDPSFQDIYQDYLLFLYRRRRSWPAKVGMNVIIAAWVLKLLVECLVGMFKKRE